MLHGDEPLFRGAEDDRIMTAPAMRVGVVNRAFCACERTTLPKQVDNGLVCVENLLTAIFRQAFGNFSGVTDRAVDLKAIAQGRLIVLAAVARRRVDASGA